ncbi:hypothetical protein LWI29_027266 [Acer saccharum]|uniref:Reverse transcriptase domain-containing protein n=1 Tax=Acer saccharum TaxID=4024 RepID=A0AA39RN42_ACESA|nr:hypothetical protein LWI29_027266 [Acer saccharum]
MGQIVDVVRKNEPGRFPSQSEQARALTVLRSGRVLDTEVVNGRKKEDTRGSEEVSGKEARVEEEVVVESTPKKTSVLHKSLDSYVPPPPYVPPIPFPGRLKRDKLSKAFKEIFDVLSKVHVNLPLLEMIEKMPAYAKFFKSLHTNRQKFGPNHQEYIAGSASAVLQKELPPKLKDPGSFCINITVGGTRLERAMLDLGASINLMPYSIYKQLGLNELKPTTMSLLLADGSVRYPRGNVEDTVHGNSKDVQNGKLSMTVLDETVEFKLFEASSYPAGADDCSFIEVLDPGVDGVFKDEDLEDWDWDDQDDKTEDSSELAEEEVEDFQVSTVNFANDPPPKLELKELPTTLKYVYLGENETYPVIIASELQSNEEERLIGVLQKHKSAIGWSIEDIKGISPTICMHKIFLEEDSRPSREAQRRLNLIMKEVVKKEVLKLLQVGIIYPISDSKWVSPIHVVPKKSGITVVRNEQNELVPQRLQTGWRVCIDYRKLNTATRKDHFPLPFIDQMLERLAGHSHYSFLDGYSGYNQIAIAPKDQEKTTFTCPFGTFAYRRMSFGLCNAPGTFQRCMMSIFSDMLEEIIEVFMDDFSVFGDSFDLCLHNLTLVLKRCEENNLVLNWEKCHFMVQQGIVLGHVISRKGIEVDKAKVEVISSLQPPKSVKDVRSFLGHAGFYRRFIKDFSKITRPLCLLLQKETEF